MKRKLSTLPLDENRKWFEIKNATEESADIFIYDEIGVWGIEPKQVISDLAGLKGKALNVHINSPGGSVFDGMAIYNTLAAHDGEVAVHIDGLAASIASVIAMAGTSITMADNALLMIHDPYTFAMGTAEELRKDADVLDSIKETIITVYENRTEQERSEIAQWMADETWLNADEALDKGFATEKIEGRKAAAMTHFDLSCYNNAPAIESPAPSGKQTPMSILLKRQKLVEITTQK